MREGAGRPTKIPGGDGERMKVTVACGSELMDLLRAKYPGLSDQDVVRAAMWAAAGIPKA